jgi:mRNA-degrading endonuclease toxin of MazEF toxin-antitoxin module
MFLRGTVWEYHFESGAPPKPALVVSNNGRNRSRWPFVHVVRITTAPKVARGTIVELPAGEGVEGRIVCDDLAPVPKSALGRQLGALSPEAMRRVDGALKKVLALR